ncbi:N-acetylmuramoyl-L-alanine amidase [Streptomyces sp. N2-109]|uniref:N-acetylmuramoyl-L-alanine amidase n=1 Tax=Streptomyces gossypii TaxID=2883101 RepID=A0ABT2K426_9ACTN|nr:N-acetylmuramoyl-L-alanine amidase [Streptomyces gossypii]MCT2594234.1 N-acetylmuramoyl-L-alanine amidase [Streptomyces gossypii]
MNGAVIHHTAGRNSLSLCYNGTSSLPGPLCHTHLSKSGTASMLSAGRANHAGSFARNAHDAVVSESATHPRPSASESVDGNAHYYGIEIENLGDGRDPYPAVQYDAAVRWAAAICRFHGWSADSVIGHKEGTRRKIDPTFSMDRFRADVAERLKDSAGSDDTTPDKEDDNDMPQYVSLTRTDSHTVEPGKWVAIEFGNEYADDRGDHAKDGSQFVHGPALYDGTCSLKIEGMDVGAQIQMRAVEIDHKTGKSVSDGPIGEFFGSDGATYPHFAFTDYVSSGRGVRIRMVHFSSKPVEIKWACLKSVVWGR